MDRIRSCREALGMSQKFVAVSIGVSTATVSMWEGGSKEPARENLVKLADLFNVTTDYLLERDPAGMAIPVSEDERAVLLAYRQVSPEIRGAVRAVLGVPAIEKSAHIG